MECMQSGLPGTQSGVKKGSGGTTGRQAVRFQSRAHRHLCLQQRTPGDRPPASQLEHGGGVCRPLSASNLPRAPTDIQLVWCRPLLIVAQLTIISPSLCALHGRPCCAQEIRNRRGKQVHLATAVSSCAQRSNPTQPRATCQPVFQRGGD